eukprot:SAG22_NODE_253_length_13622_cov_15.026471_3_plen_564_part_00
MTDNPIECVLLRKELAVGKFEEKLPFWDGEFQAVEVAEPDVETSTEQHLILTAPTPEVVASTEEVCFALSEGDVCKTEPDSKMIPEGMVIPPGVETSAFYHLKSLSGADIPDSYVVPTQLHTMMAFESYCKAYTQSRSQVDKLAVLARMREAVSMLRGILAKERADQADRIAALQRYREGQSVTDRDDWPEFERGALSGRKWILDCARHNNKRTGTLGSAVLLECMRNISSWGDNPDLVSAVRVNTLLEDALRCNDDMQESNDRIRKLPPQISASAKARTGDELQDLVDGRNTQRSLFVRCGDAFATVDKTLSGQKQRQEELCRELRIELLRVRRITRYLRSCASVPRNLQIVAAAEPFDSHQVMHGEVHVEVAVKRMFGFDRVLKPIALCFHSDCLCYRVETSTVSGRGLESSWKPISLLPYELQTEDKLPKDKDWRPCQVIKSQVMNGALDIDPNDTSSRTLPMGVRSPSWHKQWSPAPQPSSRERLKCWLPNAPAEIVLVSGYHNSKDRAPKEEWLPKQTNRLKRRELYVSQVPPHNAKGADGKDQPVNHAIDVGPVGEQ